MSCISLRENRVFNASPVSRLAIKTRFFSKTPHPRINDGSEVPAGRRCCLSGAIIDPGVGGVGKAENAGVKKNEFLMRALNEQKEKTEFGF